MIQYLCERNVKNSKFIPLISKALQVDIEWLTTRKGTFQKTTQNNALVYEVPVLDEEDLKYFLKEGIFLSGKNLTHVLKSFSNSQDPISFFSFVIKDSSMLPIFPIGSTVFVDRKQMLKNEGYGLFLIGEKDILLRKIEVTEEQVTLIAFNQNIYKNISFKADAILIGMVSNAIIMRQVNHKALEISTEMISTISPWSSFVQV